MKANTLENTINRFELYIFIFLILLQVNFFHFSFLPQSLVDLNSDINKQLVLFVIIISYTIFMVIRYSLKNYKFKYSLTFSIGIFIVTLIVLTLVTKQSYDIPLFQTFKNSYYYWIIIYFFPCVFVIKNYLNKAVFYLKIIGFLDIFIILIQDIAYFKFGRLILSLDEFSLSMLSVNNRFVTDGDFLLFVSFIIFFIGIWSKKGINKFDISYLILFIIHQIFFAKGRVALLIFLCMFAGFLIFYIVKLPKKYQYMVLLGYAMVGAFMLYNIIIKLSFFSGERAISGQVRLYEIQYYLEYAKLHTFWGIGFTDDQLLLHGGFGQLLGGKYSMTDVGVIGYFGIFGYIGVPFIVSYSIQLIRLCMNSRSLGITLIVLTYFIGQCGTLFPLNIPRIFLFTVASAFVMVLINRDTSK